MISRHLAGLANPSQASPRQANQVARSAAGLQINFELLPRVHGGLVRVVVPGYVGAGSVKVIEVLRHCSKGLGFNEFFNT
jgi:DMSO/TMAO reductase YedYZ molybdopterin-dependent catalytic subunit